MKEISHSSEQEDVAPILRAVFPTLSGERLRVAHAEFSRFLGLQYDAYMNERLSGVASLDERARRATLSSYEEEQNQN